MTADTKPISLYDTLRREKVTLTPDDPDNVRMYVCGPTVYDYAHIGNARPIVVFDVLYRLLRQVYGVEHVTYARNITDVDDKINTRAAEEFGDLPLNEAIAEVTTRTTAQFHADIAALGVLEPTVEPRCTGHIDEMIAMIETLIAKDSAYAAEGHVLLDTTQVPDYGKLSGRSLDEMIAGARVEVAPYKRNPADSVLWKPSNDTQPGWESPWGRGRPGWHIECSAMAEKHLGKTFDIHGGGIDLAFPHHENELAQSRAAHGTDRMASIWMHNGFLQVEGEKMSKSLGNFFTIRQVLETPIAAAGDVDATAPDQDWQVQWNGLCARLSMLQTRYREPLDWTARRFSEAGDELLRWYECLRTAEFETGLDRAVPEAVLASLADDLNTPAAITHLRAAYSERNADVLGSAMAFLGLLDPTFVDRGDLLLFNRALAVDDAQVARIEALIEERLAARAAKDFARSDEIRDALAADGILLKDGKDPDTGQPITTWDVKR